MTPRLAEHYRVVAPDLRGHGRSGHARQYSWEAYAEDIEALVQRIAGNGPYFLAGHCTGGYVGMLVAARGIRPPAALAVFDLFEPSAKDLELLTSLAAPSRRTYRTRAELQRAMSGYPRGRGMSPDQRTILREEIFRRRPDGRWVVTPDPRVVMHGPWRTADLASRVQCPILFIRGGESRKVSRIDLLLTAMQFPHGRVDEVPGTGHCMVIEDPEGSSAVLERFFQDIPLGPVAMLPDEPLPAGN